jgi:phage baseplate assembly protein W
MATIFYKDLSLDFTPHPVTGDVRPITNETAIKRSLANLIRTKRGTRPFYPEYGSTLADFLFSDMNVFSAHSLKQELTETIKKFEPRVTLTSIQVDTQSDENGIQIKIDFIIKNIGVQSSLQTTLTRTA